MALLFRSSRNLSRRVLAMPFVRGMAGEGVGKVSDSWFLSTLAFFLHSLIMSKLLAIDCTIVFISKHKHHYDEELSGGVKVTD